MCVDLCICGPWRPEEGADPLELQLQRLEPPDVLTNSGPRKGNTCSSPLSHICSPKSPIFNCPQLHHL